MPRGGRGTIVVLLAASTVLAVVLVLALGHSATTPSSPVAIDAAGGSGFAGAALPAGAAVHDFTLRDQQGRAVSLSSLRGRVVVLSFLFSHCGASCTVIAQQIRGALDEVGRAVPVLIVSADPKGDTQASIARFLAGVSLSGRAAYLDGPPSQLRRLWRDYRVTPASAGKAAFDLHAEVILLDRQGSERVLYQQEQLTPENLTHDIRRLEAG